MTDAPANPFRIYLLRHAHSAWPAPGMRDFDRPLDERGRDEATRLAAMMTLNGLVPERIVCSPAARCVQTLEILASEAGGSAEASYPADLYSATVRIYLDAIEAAARSGAASVMIVGHNPTIEETARALLVRHEGAAEGVLGHGFPTAGLLIVDSSAARPATEGHGQLVGLISPVDA